LIVLPLLSARPLAVFALSGAATAAAWAAIWLLPPHPAAHERAQAAESIGAGYPALLRAASWLLPFSYVVAAALAPVLPLGAGGAALVGGLALVVLARLWRCCWVVCCSSARGWGWCTTPRSITRWPSVTRPSTPAAGSRR